MQNSNSGVWALFLAKERIQKTHCPGGMKRERGSPPHQREDEPRVLRRGQQIHRHNDRHYHDIDHNVVSECPKTATPAGQIRVFRVRVNGRFSGAL